MSTPVAAERAPWAEYQADIHQIGREFDNYFNERDRVRHDRRYTPEFQRQLIKDLDDKRDELMTSLINDFIGRVEGDLARLRVQVPELTADQAARRQYFATILHQDMAGASAAGAIGIVEKTIRESTPEAAREALRIAKKIVAGAPDAALWQRDRLSQLEADLTTPEEAAAEAQRAEVSALIRFVDDLRKERFVLIGAAKSGGQGMSSPTFKLATMLSLAQQRALPQAELDAEKQRMSDVVHRNRFGPDPRPNRYLGDWPAVNRGVASVFPPPDSESGDGSSGES